MTGITPDKLPSSYQIIGDIILFKLPKLNTREKKQVAEATLNILPYVKTVCEIFGISGELRKPKVKKIVGGSTETIHKEHGIFYKLDVSKVMFSKGNLTERKRLVEQIKPSEVIIDMFAGIGYFSIPLAKKAKKIYAIEKNPISAKYLKENIELNRLNNVEVIGGDCSKTKIPERADRVIMGYFPGTEKFLSTAFGFIKSGGIIHYHDVLVKDELWNKPIEIIEKYAEKNGFKVEIIEKKRVKNFAPNIYHIVIDFKVNK